MMRLQRKRTGVATRMLKKNPAALPIHCMYHSLNLCLQDAGRQVQLLRDSLYMWLKKYRN